MTKAKPLWMQFAEMTPDEMEAEKASGRARMRARTVSFAEAIERWRKLAAWQEEQADLLERVVELAQATDCPKGVAPARWLIDKGFLVDTEGGYAFNDKKIEDTFPCPF